MIQSKIKLSVSIILLIFLGSCKDKKKDTSSDKKLFPVSSFIRSQIAQVDTSLNTIRKLVFIDSTRTDTTYIARQDFKAVAVDFLNIPDLTESKYSGRFTESEQFDETLNRVIVVALPVDAGKELVQRQEVLIKPDPSGDKITNIIVNTVMNSKDSSVTKNMLWKVDESFSVTTIKQIAGQPETTSTYKVVWNENE